MSIPTIRILLAAVAAALILGATAPAQAGTSCPHQGVRSVPSKLTFGPLQKCGSSVSIRLRGVAIRNPINACPLFAIYEPPHDKPTPKQDFRTNPDRKLPIVMIRMECSSDWLLGFIPIPIGSSCKVVSVTNIGWIQNYVEYGCDKEAGSGQ